VRALPLTPYDPSVGSVLSATAKYVLTLSSSTKMALSFAEKFKESFLNILFKILLDFT
jgi:hypothetical protein